MDQAAAQTVRAATPSGSVWGDSGTLISLSTTAITNDNASSTTGSFSSVRGTQARSSGLLYFEVKFLSISSPSLNGIGMMDDATSAGASMDNLFSSFVNTGGAVQFNGHHNGNGNGFNGPDLSGGGWTINPNDIMGVAADFTNGFGYLNLMGSYLNGGDPSSGPTGTGAFLIGSLAAARPAVILHGNTLASAQLLTTGAALSFLPSGYSPWG